MEKHLTPGGKIFFLLLILVMILLSLAALYWYKKEEINRWWQRNKPAIFTTASDRVQQKPQQTSSEKPSEKESASEDRVLRRQYLLRFNETKTFLRETLSKDHAGVHLEKWKEFAAHLRKIEKKATSSSKDYNALIDQLNHLQGLIKAVAKSKAGDNQNSQNRTDQKQKTRQQKSKPQIQDLPDYYKVLGVSEYSSVEEIKKAFRKKMQQYHPDKHNSSDFEWIKKEATKMSQLVQEAHEVLNDPLKRKEYNENYRAQKRVKL
jgi:DnaJ-domain-containing protein 1